MSLIAKYLHCFLLNVVTSILSLFFFFFQGSTNEKEILIFSFVETTCELPLDLTEISGWGQY